MRVIITGASGFVGRHLVADFAKASGVDVYCVIRRPGIAQSGAMREVIVDLSQKAWTNGLPDRADLVVHLAQSTRYREFPDAARDILKVNVDATVELAAWACRAGVRRFLFASTGNVYGHASSPRDESDPTDARTMYAASKLSAELLLRPYAEFFEVVVMRLFGVYGPGQTGMLLSRIIDKVLAGEEITLAGGIGVRLNPLFIDDCVSVLRQLCDVELSNRYEIFNVGGGEVVDLAQVARYLEELTGLKARTRVTDDPHASLIGRTNKLSRVARNARFVTLQDGLRRTIAKVSAKREATS